MLAATRSPDKEGDNLGAIAMRDDSQVSALAAARAIESRVVELVRTIGEIVASADNSKDSAKGPTSPSSASSQAQVRSDSVFEYFCEKSILSLFVDIAKEKRQASEEGRRWGKESSFHGVVWSPDVKAQIFSTVALLVSECRNCSALYYLLSHNYINELILCMLPLQQWTDQALSKMMRPYVHMLQKIAIQLADDPHLFTFLTMQTTRESDATTFPLFSAVLETATGVFAQADSLVYGTCLVVCVNIMQIPHEPIQAWVCNAGREQRQLADHLCQRLVDRYFRIVNLTTGPVVDGIRSNAIAGQLAALKDHLAMIHEVFWSGVRGLDVRLCESLLQRVVTVLLKNLGSGKSRSFLSNVGLTDSDVIPEQEALAQVSTIFLVLLFSGLAYIPYQRMMAVSLLHEKSTPLWSSTRWLDEMDSSETYFFMPVLSDIVTGDHVRETCPNTFRSELIKGVSGQYGEWRTTASACLLQTALASEAIDDASMGLLKIIPPADDTTYQTTALETAIATYLLRDHKPSAVATQTLETVGFLAIQVLHKTILRFADHATNVESRVDFVLEHSPVWKAMLHAKSYFAQEAQKCQTITGVSDIFLDLVESVLSARYTARYDESGVPSFRNLLSQRVLATNSATAELLVRKLRDVGSNDVETTRFFVNMTFHFRSLCKVIEKLSAEVRRGATQGTSAGNTEKNRVRLDLVDIADDVTREVGGLVQKPEIGTDLDLTGRMTFRFQSAVKPNKSSPRRPGEGTPDTATRLKNISEDIGVFRSGTRLVLVLDPTDMYVVRPMKSKVENNRGTILCSISLRSVIAAADDREWLHVAVRADDVGFLIKNGNMALKFENSGGCLIVKQYLDRSRDLLRLELLDKMSKLLAEAKESGTQEPLEEKKDEQL